MLIDNKIEKTFSGPLVILGATFLVIAAILTLTYHWIFAMASFIVAAFILFTYSGIEIDTEKRMIKPYYMVFGILKRGKWESLDKYRGLTLVPMQKVYKTFSRSNRKNSSVKSDFRVYLVNKAKKPAFPLKSCKTQEEAQDGMDEFSIWLKMPVFTVSRH
jgi:cell division protein FtsW (lipid II flippase)